MSISEQVETLLKKEHLFTTPIAVNEVASRLGIVVVPLPASGEVSGAIIQKDGATIIGVNPAHHPNRQRFTIAHELGHFLLQHNLHEHVDGDFRVGWRNTESSRGVNWIEIQANSFAAELLMPTKLIESDLNDLEYIDQNVVQTLARKYRVSTQAMELRLVNLGLIPPF